MLNIVAGSYSSFVHCTCTIFDYRPLVLFVTGCNHWLAQYLEVLRAVLVYESNRHTEFSLLCLMVCYLYCEWVLAPVKYHFFLQLNISSHLLFQYHFIPTYESNQVWSSLLLDTDSSTALMCFVRYFFTPMVLVWNTLELLLVYTSQQ